MTWADEEVLGFDLESTGADPLTALPVSFALAKLAPGVPIAGRAALINPGVPIPPETTAIHGITDEMVAERGGDLSRSVDGIVGELLAASIAGTPLVGMNLRYDLTVIDSCYRRLNDGTGLFDVGWDGLVLDALVIDRGVDRYRKGKRNLSALCAHYGVPFGDAHNASADVVAAWNVCLAIARRYPDIERLSAREIHDKEVVWHREWAENFSEYRVGKGDDPLPATEFIWPLSGLDPGHDYTGPQLVSDGQVAHLRITLKDDHSIVERQDILAIVSQIIGDEIGSTKDLTHSQYRQVIDTLAGRMDDKRDAAQMLSDDAEAHRAKIPPLPEVDTGGASNAIVTSTMRLVMAMSSETVSAKLREFGLPRSGSVTDKRLRFYEFACQERAKGNTIVEAIFEEAK